MFVQKFFFLLLIIGPYGFWFETLNLGDCLVFSIIIVVLDKFSRGQDVLFLHTQARGSVAFILGQHVFSWL